MLRGVPSWHTSSTSPMSMPSSSEAVATITLSEPAFRRCSALKRVSFDRLPWWAATLSSPSRSASWRDTRSTPRRVFENTNVVWCSSMSLASWSYTVAQTSPDITASSGADGITRLMSRSRTCPELTIWVVVPGRGSRGSSGNSSLCGSCEPREPLPGTAIPSPTRKRATSSMGFCVADKPMRCTGCAAFAASRSSVSARCAPRLVCATAWISSTMTVRTVVNISRPETLVSSR